MITGAAGTYRERVACSSGLGLEVQLLLRNAGALRKLPPFLVGKVRRRLPA